MRNVSFEPSQIIPSRPEKDSLNGIRNLNQPLSPSHSMVDKILEGIHIEDNYLTIDDAFNTNTSFNFIPKFINTEKNVIELGVKLNRGMSSRNVEWQMNLKILSLMTVTGKK